MTVGERPKSLGVRVRMICLVESLGGAPPESVVSEISERFDGKGVWLIVPGAVEFHVEIPVSSFAGFLKWVGGFSMTLLQVLFPEWAEGVPEVSVLFEMAKELVGE